DIGQFFQMHGVQRSWFVRETPARPLHTVHLEELPDVLDPKDVYVLGEAQHRWFVAMICPCGCKETLQMSLLKDAKPKWSLIEHNDGTISLQPSIWRKIGCRSHFFLRHGLIQWCRESGGTTES
ncbi:MAG TPA: DUF6527 family protein, partial [Planctomycetaceae bacterium]|nr:DUF6527 family protein [Planctomycetaceae bacterium]